MAQYWGTGRPGVTQVTAMTSAAAQTANAFSSGVQKVRVMATTDAYITFQSTAATTTDLYLPGLSVEYFTVNPGQKLSCLQVSANGTVYVTEIS